MIKIILLQLCFLSSCWAAAQSIQTDRYGVSLGVSLAFGSTINRVGVFARGHYIYKAFQGNTEWRRHYNISSYGPPKSGRETVWKAGVVWAWGAQDEWANPFFSTVSNQTRKINSIGYSYNQYWDEIGTNQQTGFVSVQLHHLQFVMENDAFAGPPADKFRTAGVSFAYRLSEWTTIFVNSILWTGDPFTDMLDTQTDSPTYPSRYGYRDMSVATYGSYSNGVFGGGLQQMLPYGQVMRWQLGFDSEWVRHALQNVLIHDLYFVPNKLNPAKHPHIPMVASDGRQYLFEKNQVVKPANFFGQFDWNGMLFY